MQHLVTLIDFHVLAMRINVSAISWQSFGAILFCGWSQYLSKLYFVYLSKRCVVAGNNNSCWQSLAVSGNLKTANEIWVFSRICIVVSQTVVLIPFLAPNHCLLVHGHNKKRNVKKDKIKK